MAADQVVLPRARRPCITVTLNPFNGTDDLEERYPEDTADVFFVDGETNESLPAHREVLKVASSVFFRMFEGNWKEKRERRIQAPEEYKWESFKAAITLLYGEEVEVEESCIPDVYRVAHCYKLTGVLAILAREVCQWGGHLLGTVVELCSLAENVPERNNSVLNSAVQCIVCHLDLASTANVAHLSYETMLKLVKSEAVRSTELVLLRTLNKWTDLHSDITLSQVKQLYSYIRFGTIPYKCLAECSVVGHDNLRSALQNHQQMSLDGVRSNLTQITPRRAQKEVFQLYPMDRSVGTMAKEDGKTEVHLPGQQPTGWRCAVVPHQVAPAVGIVYFGKQEIKFKIDLKEEANIETDFQCKLISLPDPLTDTVAQSLLQTTLTNRGMSEYVRGGLQDSATVIKFLCCNVVLSCTGAHLMLQSESLLSFNAGAYKKINLSSPGRLPWVLAFSWQSHNAFAHNSLVLTIHPPDL